MHESSSVNEFIDSLKEQLFKTGEKEHLRSMAHHNQKRERTAHADMLSKVQDRPHDVRQQQTEHHGLRFWTYYFENEHPDLSQPLPDYMEEAWDETLNLRSHSIEPAFTRVSPELDGVGETQETIERRWLTDFTLAQIAFSEHNYIEAECKYRAALEHANHLKKVSRKQSLAANGLAESLKIQNNLAEAEAYFEIALKIDKELLARGETSVEDEFYNIVRHFVSEEKNYCEIEKLLEDLADQLKLSVGRHDPLLAKCFNELGTVYLTEKKFETAEKYFQKAIEILERVSPRPDKQLAAVLSNYASLCNLTGRTNKAKEFYKKALQCLGSHALI